VVPLKLCEPCQRAYQRRRRAWIFWTIGVMAILAFLFTLIPDVAKEFGVPGNYIFVGVIAFIGIIVGAGLGNTFAPPVKLGRLDGKLNTLRIRFKNRDYAPIFATAVSAMPARPTPSSQPDVPLARPLRA